MQTDISEFLPDDFSPSSKVWIYQSHRLLTLQEAFEVESMIPNFTENWKSHGQSVKGYANLLFGRFLVIMADESQTGVGGCSTDSSVRWVKELGTHFNIDFFNRQLLAFIVKEKIECIPLSQVQHGINSGLLKADTQFFNNVVLTKKEMEESWIIPMKYSWLSKYFSNQ
jgi:hypothetical protein